MNKAQFKEIISRKCFYCDGEPKDFFKRENDNGKYLYNGIDRKINHLGYTVNNSLPCCRICNRAKSDMNYDDFVIYISKFKGLNCE